MKLEEIYHIAGYFVGGHFQEKLKKSSILMVLTLVPPCKLQWYSVPQDGWTALMFTSKTGHTDVVQLLLSSGAQVNLKHMVRQKSQLDCYISSHS